MLIRNYGLFWRRDYVYWGYSGHLKGTVSRGDSEYLVDFRDQQGVYVLYDEGFHLIYVGQAGAGENQRLFARLKQHRGDQLADRWSKFSWYGINKVNQDCSLRMEKMASRVEIGDVLNHIEAILITAAEPPHNRQGGRFGDDVEQYFQYRDPQMLAPTSEDMLKEIYEWIKKQ